MDSRGRVVDANHKWDSLEPVGRKPDRQDETELLSRAGQAGSSPTATATKLLVDVRNPPRADSIGTLQDRKDKR